MSEMNKSPVKSQFLNLKLLKMNCIWGLWKGKPLTVQLIIWWCNAKYLTSNTKNAVWATSLFSNLGSSTPKAMGFFFTSTWKENKKQKKHPDIQSATAAQLSGQTGKPWALLMKYTPHEKTEIQKILFIPVMAQ